MVSHPVADRWLAEHDHQRGMNDDPNYFASRPETLLTTSELGSFTLGTGAEVLSSVFQSCELTVNELIIVTCFWASSASQLAVNQLLMNLSNKASAHTRVQPAASVAPRQIRVRLCISSISLIQKLRHTSSANGHIYPKEFWQKLGLPPAELLSGLDLVVKTIFIRPFSVMHPKFILMDRERAWFPSCNVSWEHWFEGCIELRGEVTSKLFDFWVAFWGREGGGMELPSTFDTTSKAGWNKGETFLEEPAVPTRETSRLLRSIELAPSTTQAILLPSPHHQQPNFQYSSFIVPPPTPLNTFLLTLFESAVNSIWISTPNLTCGPVIEALILALGRGTNVTIVSSRRMMLLEQLVTAGTITEFEIWKLCRRYRRMTLLGTSDPEAGRQKFGALKIGYFQPWRGEGEPVKIHLKMTVVDDEIMILGSGNMDRASWFTSQELGVALVSKMETGAVKDCVMSALEDRVEWICG